MSESPKQDEQAEWLRHFLELSRKFFGLAKSSLPSDEKPADHTPQPGERAGAIEKDADEK